MRRERTTAHPVTSTERCNKRRTFHRQCGSLGREAARRIHAIRHRPGRPRKNRGEPARDPEPREEILEEILEELIADHEAAVRVMRQAALNAEDQKDMVTHDMLVSRMEWREKTIWMLRAVITK
nr:ferritin-like domain-containing protein [Rhodoblastus acidophilus]